MQLSDEEKTWLSARQICSCHKSQRCSTGQIGSYVPVAETVFVAFMKYFDKTHHLPEDAFRGGSIEDVIAKAEKWDLRGDLWLCPDRDTRWFMSMITMPALYHPNSGW